MKPNIPQMTMASHGHSGPAPSSAAHSGAPKSAGGSSNIDSNSDDFDPEMKLRRDYVPQGL